VTDLSGNCKPGALKSFALHYWGIAMMISY